MKKFSKIFAGRNMFGKGAEISTTQLARINEFTLVEFKAEDLYVRKMLLAHNAIDRDEERFNEKLLGDFVATLPGKSFLIGHQWGPPGKGIFFDAETEEMSVEEAKRLTGEDIRLPDGVDTFKALFAWIYTVKEGKEALLADIDAGIARHVSIGFNAANRVRVNDEESGDTLYYEYKSPGEALEGSLVWLGAQPGATMRKGLGNSDEEGDDLTAAKSGVDIDNGTPNGRKKERKDNSMKRLFKMLGLGEESTEDQAVNILNQKELRLKSLEKTVALLGDDITDESVADMVKAAAEGKAYHADLVSRQIKAERMLGRTGDTEEAAATRSKELAKRSSSEIKGDLEYLEKQVAEKHPDGTQFDGGDPNAARDNSAVSGEKKFDFIDRPEKK